MRLDVLKEELTVAVTSELALFLRLYCGVCEVALVSDGAELLVLGIQTFPKEGEGYRVRQHQWLLHADGGEHRADVLCV